MTREESKDLAILQTQFAEFLRREAERDKRETERDRKLDEMYDWLRSMRVITAVGKWLALVGGGIALLVKTGDWSELLRAFGK